MSFKSKTKKVAFVFSLAPHGSSAGREGLDALLATSVLTKEIGAFFICDGVLQILPNQQPEKILARNYIATYGVLSVYDINQCFICEASLRERGLSEVNNWVIDVARLSPKMLRQQLISYDVIITF